MLRVAGTWPFSPSSKARRPQEAPGESSDSDSETGGKAARGRVVVRRAKPRGAGGRGCFDAAADARLCCAKEKFGSNWTAIAKEVNLPGVDAKQCRDRFNNHANPELNHTPLRAEEVPLLIEQHKRFGNAWTKIANALSDTLAAEAAAAGAAPGSKTRRSENWVKNVFYSKNRKMNKDASDAVYAPLYAYLEEAKAAGGGLSAEATRKRAAELPDGEAAGAEAAVQRRSARVTKRPRYEDYVDSSEAEEEEQQQQAEEEPQPAPRGPSLKELMYTPSPLQLLFDVDEPLSSNFWALADADVFAAATAAPAAPAGAASFDDIDLSNVFDTEDWLAPGAAPAAALLEDCCTVSANVPGCAALCPSVAHSARSDGAAGSAAPQARAAPQACLTPTSRDADAPADARDHLEVLCEPLQRSYLSDLASARESKHQSCRFWAGGVLYTARGFREEAAAAARAELNDVAAHVRAQWPSVQCLALVLRAGELNVQELAGVVHVGATSHAQAQAASEFAERALQALLDV